ncbi:MAG: hypothetical protein FWE16_01770 [Firmicutes bacterium]|nr:hypothetical protein [Bacillota bacterium]
MEKKTNFVQDLIKGVKNNRNFDLAIRRKAEIDITVRKVHLFHPICNEQAKQAITSVQECANTYVSLTARQIVIDEKMVAKKEKEYLRAQKRLEQAMAAKDTFGFFDDLDEFEPGEDENTILGRLSKYTIQKKHEYEIIKDEYKKQQVQKQQSLQGQVQNILDRREPEQSE